MILLMDERWNTEVKFRDSPQSSWFSRQSPYGSDVVQSNSNEGVNDGLGRESFLVGGLDHCSTDSNRELIPIPNNMTQYVSTDVSRNSGSLLEYLLIQGCLILSQRWEE